MRCTGTASRSPPTAGSTSSARTSRLRPGERHRRDAQVSGYRDLHVAPCSWRRAVAFAAVSLSSTRRRAGSTPSSRLNRTCQQSVQRRQTDRRGRHWGGHHGRRRLESPIRTFYRFGSGRRPVRIIELPVSRGTSVMFGGPDLSTLDVTTMRTTLDEQQLSEEPLAGSLLAIHPG